MFFAGKWVSNNNQDVVKVLAKACRRFSKGRNRILAGTAAVGIIVLCTVFSIALGKIEADYLLAARGNGTVASTYLERGTMEQYHAIRELDYVDSVGRMLKAGHASWGEQFIADLEVLDSVAWETMRVPAYTHIHGKYPQKKGELMLSRRALEALGISEPKEGRELSLSVELETTQEKKLDFQLCGWFTDYVDPAVNAPKGYISEAQAKEWGMSLEEPDFLLICQKNTIDGYSIEERLYEDIPVRDKTQRFLGGNRYMASVVNDFVGGYGMAAFCAALVLIGVFFLIHNIFGISIQKEIRQIGLLDTLGTTQKQIRGIYLRQTAFTICLGAVAGVAGAAVVVLLLVPKALGNLYLYNFGNSSELLVFRPEVFAAAVVFTVSVIFGAAAYTIYQAVRLTPLEALHFTGVSEKRAARKRNRESRKSLAGRHVHVAFQNPVFYMAWQNVFRYKKRCFITILSLFLGVVTALGAIVLTNGTDTTHSIEKNPDFSISGSMLMEAFESDSEGNMVHVNENDDFTPITPETKERLLSVQGVRKENAVIVRGAYLYTDCNAEALEPLEASGEPEEIAETKEGGEAEESAGEGEGNKAEETDEIGPPESWEDATIQIVDEDIIRKLEDYVEENDLAVDIESLRDGTGMVLLHYHMLSPALKEEADQKLGLPISLWRLPSREERDASWEQMTKTGYENWRQENRETVQMKLAGYLDTQAKGFPKWRRTWFGPKMKYFLVSEKGFENLRTEEKTFGMDLNVHAAYEPGAKTAIQNILQDENHRDETLGLMVYCKSDDLASRQEYIRTNRIILGALSLVLILMGLLNYMNVIITGILSRQRELAVMECVGMTGRQIQSMLAAEGGIYCVIVGGLVLTAGSAVLQLLRVYMESRIAYFKFMYPAIAAGGILAVIFAACISVPLVMERRMEKRSAVLRAVE